MSKSLVIVESPSKAHIINDYLGDSYVVKASVGHIRDLPTTGGSSSSAEGARAGSALIRRMGVDPEHGWDASYEIMPGKEKVVAELKRLARSADRIYLATDLDREGEAIAWHLREVLGGDAGKYCRVTYPEITKRAIERAFASPGDINMDLVNAQQTRRFLDRVVGFMVSPLLWKKVSRGLSAGRVQSVAVELIVDREREIKAFMPEEYWSVAVEARTASGEALTLDLAGKGGAKLALHNGAAAAAAAEEVRKAGIVVRSVESKEGSTKAPPPFTTSTLQQVANQRLGFPVRKTMRVAQQLYESGFITYMRTDSVNLSEEAIAAARSIVTEAHGKQYLPEKPNRFRSKDTAQEAHEAIRPSYPERAALPASMDRDAQRLYDLIRRRYLACQMAPERYETTTIIADAGEWVLRASGRVRLFDGFRAELPTSSDGEAILPRVAPGERLGVEDIIPAQHFTQPPARFSEATLVKQLEKDGIGRPSTYAAIISTIQERGYVRIESGRFHAEKMGEVVTDRLRDSFSDLMDVKFTAGMEGELDEIAEGKLDWRESLDRFYKGFKGELDQASRPSEEGGMPENRPMEIDMLCPECGAHHMAVVSGRTGSFLSCLGYHDSSVKAADRCHKTMNLKPLGPAPGRVGDEDEARQLLDRRRCPICHSAMDEFLVDEHLKLFLCGNHPRCGGHIIERGDFSSLIEHGPTITCDKCGGTMELKEGRFGKYMACTNKECGNTRKILRNGEVAPPREAAVDLPELPCRTAGSHYVLRDGAAGIFLAAHNFPKVRETRAPKVGELQRFRDRLSPKFHYLADAPAADPDGNETEVRFSRKTKQQYVISVKDGKPTGFTAFYNAERGRWEQREPEKAAPRRGRPRATAKRK
ncbi:MAG: type I DNA topoisomerase [Succinivibrionaceae bacterium]|nr:type I DNA topoisomerase [Succinivibrionaceae bacterium]